MNRTRLGVLVVSLLAVLAMTAARSDEPWRDKAPERWTLEDSEKVLRESPWVKRHRVFITPSGRNVAVLFAVRIRSAEPVLMALARRMAALPDAHIRSAKPPDPQTLRRTARGLNIPGLLLITIQSSGPEALDALNRQSLRTFRDHSYIELAGSGQRIHPIGYDAPWQNELERAVFHFPRPTAEEVGRRITFVARFGAPNIVTLKADFDAEALRWEGRIEY